MARIDTLPSLEIIRGLKGILDFYVWRGLPCVRAWPKYRPAKQTAASLAAALVFGAIVKSYNLLGNAPLEAYREDALDQPRTARDIMVTGIYGNLHEASMSDFLTLLQESRDFLSDLTALLDALHSIDTDELVVRVEHSVLPDTAATAAAQATQLSALQKIDDLQDALESKALDRLLVRGMDQLFSFKQPLGDYVYATISGANGQGSSNSPAAGELWVVTAITGNDITSPTTNHVYRLIDAVLNPEFYEVRRALAANEKSSWAGHLYLVQGDVARIYFAGGQVNDKVQIQMIGYIMTLET